MGKKFKVDKDKSEEVEKAVKLISITPDAENLIAYCARVSSKNQDNPNIEKLLTYCYEHGHWSVFETAYITMEINTSRAISAQILRHRSFTFQEFSQRYAQSNELGKIELPDLRRQDTKNRQNSIDDVDPFVKQKLEAQMITLFSSAQSLYNQMIEEGIAKECARMVLPLCTPTRIYMTGSARSWIH